MFCVRLLKVKLVSAHPLLAAELVFSFRYFTGRMEKLNIETLVKRNSRQTVWYFHVFKVLEDGAT